MKIQLIRKNWDSIECDALIVPLFEDEGFDEGLPKELDGRLGGLLSEMRRTEEWKGKAGEWTILYRPDELPVQRLLLLGAGKREEYRPDLIRRLLTLAVRRLKGYNFKRIAVFRRSQGDLLRSAQAAVEGVVLATYDPGEYKTVDRAKSFVEEILFATSEAIDTDRVEEVMRRALILGEATNLARQLVNEPGNRINPSRFAEKAREIAEKTALQVKILGEPEMEKLGMNAVLAVARGSDEPARFVVLQHRGAGDDQPPAVFIGKGVTFDSGGLSLKPPQSMEDMKADKAGACAVLAALQAIARLQLVRNVVGIIPLVENLPSGRAQRPGDVIHSMSGRTIEVINTDAEGRLIMADALTYAAAFKPEFIIDIATLTGACVVALGHVRAGLFSNNDTLCSRLLQAAERAGERLWRLPLDSDYRKEIESDIADIKNVGGRWGGAITAAKFLEEFTGGIPWCHIDMAGVDMYTDKDELKGPTGFGVRTLVELLLSDPA